MNNFKKLLASAMALSMVASVLPATNVNAAVDSTCDTTESTNLDYYSRLALFLRRNDVDFTSMNSDHMITTDMNVFDYVLDVNVDVEAEETVEFEFVGDVIDSLGNKYETFSEVADVIAEWIENGEVAIDGTPVKKFDVTDVEGYLRAHTQMSVTHTTSVPENLFKAISNGYA